MWPVAPICSSEVGQSAFLPSKVLRDLPCGSLSEITLTARKQRVKCLCWAYPQTRDRDSFSEVPLTVCSDQLLDSRHEVIKMESVEKCSVGDATSVGVTILCNSVGSSIKLKSQRLQTPMKLLLSGLALKQGYVVRPTKHPVLKALDIAAVIVDATDGDDGAFVVGETTEISVDRIVSKQRYMLSCGKSGTKAFGGMESQTRQLEKVIDQSQRSSSTNAMRGFLVVGPPGSGKTSLVDKVRPFSSIDTSSFILFVI